MPEYLSPGVYVEERPSGSMPLEAVGTAVAAFIGYTERRPEGDDDGLMPRLVTNWGQYESNYGGFIEGALLPQCVYGYFANGGGRCYVVPIAHTKGASGRPSKALPSGAKKEIETLEVEALKTEDSVDVIVSIDPTEGDQPAESFTLIVKEGGKETEKFEHLTFGKGKQNVAQVVNSQSKAVRVKAPPASGVSVLERLPAAGTYSLEPAEATPIRVAATHFEGSNEERTGIHGLAIADDVTMISMPDLATAAQKNGSVDLEMFKAVQTALIAHCELAGNRMAILDPPPNLSPQEVREWRSEIAMFDSKFATMYYPWIKVPNPLANGEGPVTVAVPPSGHVAGVWARSDNTRGVWKAPANEVVQLATDVAVKVTKGEQDMLNPIGVNCIRPFGTRGIRIWGARTLSSDPSWRYVNVRRLFNMIEESVLRGTQWSVFEPNDLALWQRVKRTITAFLTGIWQQGALVGATAGEAFYVKCDSENNPPNSVDEGKLIVDVGIAPVKPAEFVIFRISQWQGGSAAAE